MRTVISDGKPMTFPKGWIVTGLALQTPSESKSGKTLVVATSHGNQATQVTIQERPVIVGYNAYIKPE